MLTAFQISYTYGHLLPTLCMIESPETEAYVPVDTIEPTDGAPPAYSPAHAPKPVHRTPNDLDDDADADADAEILLVRNKPYTASIRQTILHLRARAGYWSRFRGLSVFLVWNMATGFLVSIIGGIFHNRMGVAVAAIIADYARLFQVLCSAALEESS